MKRNIISVFLILFCFILQSSVLPAVAFSGIKPNQLIILVAAYGFMNGEKTGMLIGFFCGLPADIFSGNVIGLYAVSYTHLGNGCFG